MIRSPQLLASEITGTARTQGQTDDEHRMPDGRPHARSCYLRRAAAAPGECPSRVLPTKKCPARRSRASGAVQYAHVGRRTRCRADQAVCAPAPILITKMEHLPVRMVNHDVAPFFGPGSCLARVRATVRARHAPAATRKMVLTPARADGLGQNRRSGPLRVSDGRIGHFALSHSWATPRSDVAVLKSRKLGATLRQVAENTLDGRPRCW